MDDLKKAWTDIMWAKVLAPDAAPSSPDRIERASQHSEAERLKDASD